MTVHVVTDSTCDIPPALITDLGITIVPLSVRFGDEELLDGVEITSEQFFKRLQREQATPSTAAPSSGQFREAYERLIAEGATGIVSVHLSAKLSATHEAAKQGAEGLSIPIHVVDSGLFSLGLGLGAVEAAKAAQAGCTVEQVQAVAEDTFRRSQVFVTLETLEYLRRGGRLSRGQEILGTLLKVKPILASSEGEVVAVGRIRTKQKAVEDILSRLADLRPWAYVYVVHATTPDELAYVTDRYRGLSPETPVLTGRMTPVIGVHAGPGGIGIGCVSAPDDQSPAWLPA
jgi:DegV family protein with EDD domain